MSRIFITGSTDGLGRGAADVLMGDGHDVILHARTLERAAALGDLAPRAAGVVIGDLASAADQIRGEPLSPGPPVIATHLDPRLARARRMALSETGSQTGAY